MNTELIEEKTNRAQDLITLTKSKEKSEEILKKVSWKKNYITRTNEGRIFFLNKALHETLQIFWNEFYKLAKVSALKMSKSNKKYVKKSDIGTDGVQKSDLGTDEKAELRMYEDEIFCSKL